MLFPECLRQISELKVTVFQEKILTHHLCAVNWFPSSRRISRMVFIFVTHSSMHSFIIFHRNKCFKIMLGNIVSLFGTIIYQRLQGIFTSSTSSFHTQALAIYKTQLLHLLKWNHPDICSYLVFENFSWSKFCFPLFQTWLLLPLLSTQL